VAWPAFGSFRVPGGATEVTMRKRWGFTGVLVTALAAAVLGAPPALGRATTPPVGADGASAAQAGGLALPRCSGLRELAGARCGSVRVPLDRANPSLGTTGVAFALIRRRAASRPSLGTIVYNPGGPGARAISSEAAPFVRGLASLRRRRDVLLVDPRGTGRSEALGCDAFADPGLAFASRKRVVAAVGACGRELGNRAGLYGTAAVADDIEVVRAALGLERLDLWGESYGTYLMPVYAARHPGQVRSMVLSGAAPIEFDPWGRDRLGAARRAIRLVCARTRACRGDAVLRDLARLATRLRRDPVRFAVIAGARRFGARLDEGALAALVYAGGNPAHYGRLPAVVASALAGDPAPLRRLAENYALGFAAVVGQPSVFSQAQNVAIACHDYPRVFSYADPPAARRVAYERALAALDASEFSPFSPAGWTQAGFDALDNCIEWPNDPTAGSPLAPGTPLPDVPVLVLAGDLDANTPSLAGRQAAAQFRRATFVEIPNVGHTPTDSPCAAALAARFIATLTVSRRACAGTGAPPPVGGRAPRRAGQLPLVRSGATQPQRRALALIVATVRDLLEQAATIEGWGAAGGLRGGRYVARPDGAVRLRAVRVVRDARVSGALALADRGGLEGTLRLTGPGIADGRLQVRLSPNGRGRAAGVLAGQHVDFAFR
jgi:pimeloyl-ACP methyl ester carboxylesterase